MPVVTDLPTAPSSSDLTTFEARADALVAALPTLVSEINVVASAFNFNATNSTSTTSLLISVGTKTLNFGAGKSYTKGMALTLAYSTDPTQWMRGEVLTYDSGTGDGTFNARTISSTTGTYAAWTISQASVEGLVVYNHVYAHTANGHGSTNTKIQRLQTVSINTGTAITYADSATLGASFTINEPGLYTIRTTATNSGGACSFGASVNSAQLTTDIGSITAANRLILASSASASAFNPSSWTGKLVAGDVVRPHDSGTPDGASEPFQNFSIIKIANI